MQRPLSQINLSSLIFSHYIDDLAILHMTRSDHWLLIMLLPAFILSMTLLHHHATLAYMPNSHVKLFTLLLPHQYHQHLKLLLLEMRYMLLAMKFTLTFGGPLLLKA